MPSKSNVSNKDGSPSLKLFLLVIFPENPEMSNFRKANHSTKNENQVGRKFSKIWVYYLARASLSSILRKFRKKAFQFASGNFQKFQTGIFHRMESTVLMRVCQDSKNFLMLDLAVRVVILQCKMLTWFMSSYLARAVFN